MKGLCLHRAVAGFARVAPEDLERHATSRVDEGAVAGRIELPRRVVVHDVEGVAREGQGEVDPVHVDVSEDEGVAKVRRPD